MTFLFRTSFPFVQLLSQLFAGLVLEYFLIGELFVPDQSGRKWVV